MMRDIPSIARALILMLAFAWPFGAILYIPVLNLTLLPAAGALVVVLALVDAIQHREHRPPFELTWPVAVAIVLVWFDSRIEHPLQYSIGLALFLAIVQLARGERYVSICLRTTATAGALLAGLAAVNFFITAMNASPFRPFSYINPPGIVVAPMLASSEAFWDYALALPVCFFAAFPGWMGKPRAPRLIAVLALAAYAIPMFVVALGIWSKHWWITLPELQTPGVAHVVFVLILLWLAARTMARTVVSRREREEGVRAVAFFVGIAFVGLLLLTPHLSFPAILIVPALLAGRAEASPAPQKRTLPVTICILPAVALLGLNLLRVYPANTYDPRNYEAVVRQDVREHRLDRAWRHISTIRVWHHWEPRACFWTARLALSFNRPYQAAHEFGNAVGDRASSYLILPPPTQAETNDFLVRIRDYCSNMADPQAQYAYEKALVAAGETSSALSLLGVKASGLQSRITPMDRNLLNKLVGLALGCRYDAVALSGMTDGDLWGLLLSWGAEVHSGVVPGLEKPAAVVVCFGVRDFRGDIVAPERTDAFMIYTLTFEGKTQDPSAPLPTPFWVLVTGAGGPLHIWLDQRPRTGNPNAGHHQVGSCSDFTVSVADCMEPPFPDKPAILILLP